MAKKAAGEPRWKNRPPVRKVSRPLEGPRPAGSPIDSKEYRRRRGAEAAANDDTDSWTQADQDALDRLFPNH